MEKHLRENKEFFDNFPFAVDVLQNPQKYGIHLMNEDGLRDSDDFATEFRVADSRFLFRQNLNIGLPGTSSFRISTEKDRKNQVGAFQQVLFAVDANCRIVKTLHWPDSDEDERFGRQAPTFARDIFVECDSHSNLHCYFDEIVTLVLLEGNEWCLDTKNDDVPRGRFGELQSRQIKITVYYEPKCGFRELFHQSNVYEHLYLNNIIMNGGLIRKDHDIWCISGRLAEMCLYFQKQVYEKEMKRLYEDDSTRGFSLKFSENEKILVYEIAGVRTIQLENEDALIILRSKNDYTNLYFHSCEGTLPDIRKLVLDVIGKWQDPEVRKRFQSKESVRLDI